MASIETGDRYQRLMAEIRVREMALIARLIVSLFLSFLIDCIFLVIFCDSVTTYKSRELVEENGLYFTQHDTESRTTESVNGSGITTESNFS